MTNDEFAKSEAWLKESLLAQELLKQSYFREKTFKALLFHSSKEDATFDEVAEVLKIQQPGAWKCYNRGRDSVFRAFFTIKLALLAGVLDLDTADHLTDDLFDFSSFKRGDLEKEEFRARVEQRMADMYRKRGASPKK